MENKKGKAPLGEQKHIYRRFQVRQGRENLLPFAEEIMARRGITRDDLMTILKCFKLNPQLDVFDA